MTGRRGRRAPPQREYVPGSLLDWTDAVHWDRFESRPCRYWGRPTQLRDSARKPAHKVCAEQALTDQAADAAAAYRTRGTL
ncbi:hypothetical protein AB9Q10_16280 [Streptomyces krungchingensis]|uniref:hypothetical protein n=1 Tax=Streptomyces krungchingensis TaxID=1565034 RepID=UPI003CF2D075